MNAQAITPIALFVYNRPHHTRRALEALARCTRLGDCSVHIYCDGAKNAAGAQAVASVRDTVHDWADRFGAEVAERKQNMGLARSVVAGVTELSERYGRVIVLEDDLVVSPDFLSFMLQALDRYEDEPSVYQVAGHMHPIDYRPEVDAYFLPRIESWGWATWARAWRAFDRQATNASAMLCNKVARRRFDLEGSYPYAEMLRQRLAGQNDSWGILWYWSVFRASGLVLYPRTSLVWNGGFDGSGVHCEHSEPYRDEGPQALRSPILPQALTFPRRVAVDEVAYRHLVHFLNSRKPSFPRRLAYDIARRVRRGRQLKIAISPLRMRR